MCLLFQDPCALQKKYLQRWEGRLGCGRSSDSAIKSPGLESCLYYLLAMWPQSSQFPPLKSMNNISTYFIALLWRLNSLIQVHFLTQRKKHFMGVSSVITSVSFTESPWNKGYPFFLADWQLWFRVKKCCVGCPMHRTKSRNSNSSLSNPEDSVISLDFSSKLSSIPPTLLRLCVGAIPIWLWKLFSYFSSTQYHASLWCLPFDEQEFLISIYMSLISLSFMACACCGSFQESFLNQNCNNLLYHLPKELPFIFLSLKHLDMVFIYGFR